MKTERFHKDGDRYRFDFDLCSLKKGYAQIDTDQDAWYYGMWTNPYRLITVSYCEGDITIQTADTVKEYVEHIHTIEQWNKKSGSTCFIDPGLNNEMIARFTEIGLGNMLH